MKCVFCGKEMSELESNNASPFRGRCCSRCNDFVVVPARLLQMQTPPIILFNIDNLSIDSYTAHLYTVDVNTIIELLNTDDIVFKCDVTFKNKAYAVIATKLKKQMKMNKMFNQLFEGQCNPLRGNVLIIDKAYL